MVFWSEARSPCRVRFNLKPEDYIDSQETEPGKMGCWLGLLPVPDTGKGPLVVLGYPFLRQVGWGEEILRRCAECGGCFGVSSGCFII